MDETIVHVLLEINRRFYQDYAEPFAATRRRIQDGVRTVVNNLPDGNYLDLGCGSGTLAGYWTRPRMNGKHRQGLYLGVDFSAGLLTEARRSLPVHSLTGLGIAFQQHDLMTPDWHSGIEGVPFDGIFAFAVLHHLPGHNNRVDFLSQVRTLAKPGAVFILSVWQIQNSPKLLARRLPWESAGLQEDQVEAGDFLLDWRQSSKGSPQNAGLRYVHVFSEADLNALALETGWKVESSSYHDGHTGNLGLYQIWRIV
ncbi:MAG TPA: class I SAM-dependent methyltransferase [Leptolinea sp.]